MAGLQAVANSKIYIGRRVAAKGAVVLADFTGATWTEIDGWATAGAIGDTQEVVTQGLISQERVRKAKGTKNAGRMENTFAPMPNDAGQLLFKAAIEDCSPYEFKVEWGAGCAPEDVVTISNGADAEVTWPGGHGLEAGSPVVFSNEGGALPTGITAGTVYYVLADDLTATTFQFSLTPGGASITTSSAGTGVHTATAQPAGQTNMFYGLAFDGQIAGGEANTARTRTWAIEIDSNILEI